MLSRISLFLSLSLLAGCTTTTGVVPVGPGIYFLSDMRAPAAGGGTAAAQAVVAEARAFCAAQQRAFAPLWMRPDGDPATPYYPTAYDATFRCLPLGDKSVGAFQNAPMPPFLSGAVPDSKATGQ